jgi:hypothetical protein
MGTRSYEDFIATKRSLAPPAGFDVSLSNINPMLFDFQKDIVRWNLKRGKSCTFADCGMGKTGMELEWAHHVNEYTQEPVLILAPLAVAQQTIREGEKFGRLAHLCESQSDVINGINITNYEKMHHFDLKHFAGVVGDESSCLKAYDSKTTQQLLSSFADTPYKLAATATPAPNDITELTNHVEFMGIMTRAQMLSSFFVHDGGSTQDWRLKGHAEEAFWAWMCSWAVMIQRPSDLGYADGDFVLPPLEEFSHIVEVDTPIEERLTLWDMEATDLQSRGRARRQSIPQRIAKAREIVDAEPHEQWLLWCGLNDESAELTRSIPGAVEVKGSDSNAHKEQALLAFANGNIQHLVTKGSIAGWGMNFQSCARQINVGMNDSWETRYQTIRRSWRFGQKRAVHIHDIIGQLETATLRNIARKEKEAQAMMDGMRRHMMAISRQEIRGAGHEQKIYHATRPMTLPTWLQEETA